jgi:hypothetical protein
MTYKKWISNNAIVTQEYKETQREWITKLYDFAAGELSASTHEHGSCKYLIKAPKTNVPSGNIKRFMTHGITEDESIHTHMIFFKNMLGHVFY